MTPGAVRILDAMRWLEEGRIPMPWPRQLVAYAGEHLPRSRQYREAVAELNASGKIRSLENGLVLEQEGREAVTAPDDGFTRRAYWEKLAGLISPVERAIAEAFEDQDEWIREDLARVVGSSESTFRSALSKLITVRLVDVDGERYRRTQVLYPLDVFEQRSTTRRSQP